MFVYYFTGNFLFGFTLYFVFVLPVDRPIQAFINLKEDIRDAKQSKYYKIQDYLENFREEFGD